MSTSKASAQNKKAWEHRAYEYWVKSCGEPKDLASTILKDPVVQLKKHRSLFQNIPAKRLPIYVGQMVERQCPLPY